MAGDEGEVDSFGKALERVRRFTVSRLKAGDRPSDLSFALAYVAAEMGLRVTDGQEPLGVFRTVLHALAAAAANGAEAGHATQADAEHAPDMDDRVPTDAVFH